MPIGSFGDRAVSKLPHANDSYVFVLNHQMDDEQDSKFKVAAHRTIALFALPRSVDVSQE
jgi:hypothetical protein